MKPIAPSDLGNIHEGDIPHLHSDSVAIDAVIRSRFACRAFANRPVSQETVAEILSLAAYAPSAANTQPVRVHVVAGAALKELSRQMIAAHRKGPGSHSAEYVYHPQRLPTALAARRAAFEAAASKQLGIAPDDAVGQSARTERNFSFFGAPAALIFTLPRGVQIGGWIELGAFLQTLMLAAHARGLATCPQQTLARYHTILREALPITEDELVACGMSLGHPKLSRKLERPPRLALNEFATFTGIERH